MGRTVDSIGGVTGRTPLIKINKLIDAPATVYAKLEFQNPLSSVKARIGTALIQAGERDGKNTPDPTNAAPPPRNPGTAPPLQAAQGSASDDADSGSWLSVTISEMASRPPGFRMRAASRNTAALSGDRLMTPLLITTSTLASALDTSSM